MGWHELSKLLNSVVIEIVDSFGILLGVSFDHFWILNVLTQLNRSPESRQRHRIDVIHLLNLFLVTTLDLQLSFKVHILNKVIKLH